MPTPSPLPDMTTLIAGISSLSLRENKTKPYTDDTDGILQDYEKYAEWVTERYKIIRERWATKQGK